MASLETSNYLGQSVKGPLPLITGRLLHPDLSLHDRCIRGIHDDIKIGCDILECQRWRRKALGLHDRHPQDLTAASDQHLSVQLARFVAKKAAAGETNSGAKPSITSSKVSDGTS